MLVHDFNPDFTLAVSAAGLCGATITGVLSFRAQLYAKASPTGFRRSARFLVLALLFLVFTACWKRFLYDSWAGGFDRSSFSADFDLAPSSFAEVSHKPLGWLVYVLFLWFLCAFSCFMVGVWHFLRILFPRLNRINSVLTLRA